MLYVNLHTHRPDGHNIEPSSAGIHPWDADRTAFEAPDIPDGVQAVGEIGLDFLCGVDRQLQTTVLRRQLQLAVERDLPVILHCVRAFEPLMKILKEYPLRAVVFHGFIGSAQQALSAVARGYFLSFGLRSLHSSRTVGAMRSVPPESMFLETDDDDISIGLVYERAAQLLGISVTELQRITLRNYEKIFLKRP